MRAALAIATASIALVAVPTAGATTYNNDTPIMIPAVGGASPNPSSITVTGTSGAITDVNVGLDGLSHSTPGDIAIVLVAPNGLALGLMDCVGNQITPAVGAFITLDDASDTKLPDDGAVTSGTFEPTAYCRTGHPPPGPGVAFGNPGPFAGGAATFATTFNGSSAIGTWNLFVRDSSIGGGSGSIPGGWSLDVKPDVTPPPVVTQTPTTPAPAPTPAKKGCKKKGKKKGKKGAAAACKKKRKKK